MEIILNVIPALLNDKPNREDYVISVSVDADIERSLDTMVNEVREKARKACADCLSDYSHMASDNEENAIPHLYDKDEYPIEIGDDVLSDSTLRRIIAYYAIESEASSEDLEDYLEGWVDSGGFDANIDDDLSALYHIFDGYALDTAIDDDEMLAAYVEYHGRDGAECRDTLDRFEQNQPIRFEDAEAYARDYIENGVYSIPDFILNHIDYNALAYEILSDENFIEGNNGEIYIMVD